MVFSDDFGNLTAVDVRSITAFNDGKFFHYDSPFQFGFLALKKPFLDLRDGDGAWR